MTRKVTEIEMPLGVDSRIIDVSRFYVSFPSILGCPGSESPDAMRIFERCRGLSSILQNLSAWSLHISSTAVVYAAPYIASNQQNQIQTQEGERDNK